MRRMVKAAGAVLAMAASMGATMGMATGTAAAQGRFDVKIGGDVYFEAGAVSQDNDANLRTLAFRNRFRLNIVPMAKADNGLEYGARLRLRTQLNSRVIDADRTYMIAQGGFGHLRLGVTPGFDVEINYLTHQTGRPAGYLPGYTYNQAMGWASPTGTTQSIDPATGRHTGSDVGGGVAGALQSGLGLMWPSLMGDNGATKILYASPRIAGFQIGGSFEPRSDSSNTDINRVKLSSTSGAQFTGTFLDVYEIGVNYIGTIAGARLAGSATYMGGTAARSPNPADSFRNLGGHHAALSVEYGGFTLGGDYLHYGDSAQNRRYGAAEETWSLQVGAQYRSGPYLIGAAFIRGVDPGQVDRSGSRRFDTYEAGAQYTVAPGLAVQIQYDYIRSHSDKPSTPVTGSPDDRAHVGMVRTTVAF